MAEDSAWYQAWEISCSGSQPRLPPGVWRVRWNWLGGNEEVINLSALSRPQRRKHDDETSDSRIQRTNQRYSRAMCEGDFMMHRESFNRRIFGMDSSRHGERIVENPRRRKRTKESWSVVWSRVELLIQANVRLGLSVLVQGIPLRRLTRKVYTFEVQFGIEPESGWVISQTWAALFG